MNDITARASFMTSKDLIRQEVLAARDIEPDREAKSVAIERRLIALPEFARAMVILTYVGVKSEVATDEIIRRGLEAGKRMAVPYVTREGLRSAFIHSEAELAPARFGLLEPPAKLRADPARACEPVDVDLFVIPGVAFDRKGGRLGYGRAYYDRLLNQARPEAAMIALAFESQVVPQVPMTPTDMYVQAVLTEKNCYRP